MNDLEAAIEERRQKISDITAEIEQLKQAQRLVAGILGGKPVKPPPAARKERPEKARPSKADANTFGCGHPRTKENSYLATYVKKDGTRSKVCKACTLAGQQKARASKTKAEPDPVLVKSASISAPPITTIPTPSRLPLQVVASPQKRCPILNFENGKPCTQWLPHGPPHIDETGEKFYTGLNPVDLGGTARGAR